MNHDPQQRNPYAGSQMCRMQPPASLSHRVPILAVVASPARTEWTRSHLMSWGWEEAAIHCWHTPWHCPVPIPPQPPIIFQSHGRSKPRQCSAGTQVWLRRDPQGHNHHRGQWGQPSAPQPPPAAPLCPDILHSPSSPGEAAALCFLELGALSPKGESKVHEIQSGFQL